MGQVKWQFLIKAKSIHSYKHGPSQDSSGAVFIPQILGILVIYVWHMQQELFPINQQDGVVRLHRAKLLEDPKSALAMHILKFYWYQICLPLRTHLVDYR